MLFDAKNFNGEVFGKYVETLPKVKLNELLKSKAIVRNDTIRALFDEQVGGNFASTPMFGRIGGTPVNYDGATDITDTTTKSYTQSRVVVGRAAGWTEKDFSQDVTGKVKFMDNVAAQVNEYWQDIDQDTLLAILKGVFSMTGAKNLEFVNGHTMDISGNAVAEKQYFDATTLNTAMQKALGDNKAKFSMTIMHSSVSTNLENMKLIKYLTYTDAEGVERELTLGSLNGRLVVVDDSMPVIEVAPVYTITADVAIDADKTYYTRSGSAGAYVYAAVASPVLANIATYYEMTTAGYNKYVTYVLGDGAIEFTDCGVAVPYEMDRNPKVNGGQTTLYSRQRKIFAPYGISFTKASMASLSPTNAELEAGANWTLVNSNESTKDYIPHKAIPIARVISRG